MDGHWRIKTQSAGPPISRAFRGRCRVRAEATGRKVRCPADVRPELSGRCRKGLRTKQKGPGRGSDRGLSAADLL